MILNALDNTSARVHVNRVAVGLKKPLFEAGTTGYEGQATVHIPGETVCYECDPKPKPEKFPVCTIRTTPDRSIHCITWAKNLFDVLFGPEDTGNMLADMKDELNVVRKAGTSTTATGNAARGLFDKLFGEGIEKVAESWDADVIGRPAPKGLRWAAVTAGAAGASSSSPTGGHRLAPATGQQAGGALDAASAAQRVWTTEECAEKFVATIAKVCAERAGDIGTLTFAKEDDDAVELVTAIANLRCTNYGIPTESRWDVQSKAGNIVPAIATTNAISAALQVGNVLHYLREKLGSAAGNSSAAAPAPFGAYNRAASKCRDCFIKYTSPEGYQPGIKKGNMIVASGKSFPPNADCLVCGSKTAPLHISPTLFTNTSVAEFVRVVLKNYYHFNEPSIMLSATGSSAAPKTLYDSEYPEPSAEAAAEGLHPDWSLQKLNCPRTGGILTFFDDSQVGCSFDAILTVDEALEDEEQFPEGFSGSGGVAAGVASKSKEGSAAKQESAKGDTTGKTTTKRPRGGVENAVGNGHSGNSARGEVVELEDDDLPQVSCANPAKRQKV